MTAQVIARWTGVPTVDRPVICDQCGEATATGAACPGCYQVAGGPVGMLAAIVNTPTGARLVIAERAPAGGWVPVRATAATGEAVRMVRRRTTAEPVAARGGTLW
jgi:hypothetical protein